MGFWALVGDTGSHQEYRLEYLGHKTVTYGSQRDWVRGQQTRRPDPSLFSSRALRKSLSCQVVTQGR